MAFGAGDLPMHSIQSELVNISARKKREVRDCPHRYGPSVRFPLFLLLLLPGVPQPQTIDFDHTAGLTRQLRFEHVPIVSNQTELIVYECVEDSFGYLWFGTVQGLYRYDGHEARKLEYKVSGDTFATDTAIRALLIDHTGDLWYGNDEGILGHLVLRSGEYKRYAAQSDSPGDFNGGSISALVQDIDRNILVGTERNGVFMLDVRTNSFVHVAYSGSDSYKLISDAVSGMILDNDGRLWIGTDNGLEILNRKTQQLIHVSHSGDDDSSLSSSSVLGLYRDSYDTIWVCTRSGINKAVVDSTTRLRFVRYATPERYVRSVLRTDFGTIWAGTKDGLTRIGLSDSSVVTFNVDDNIASSLSHGEIRFVTQDHAGLVWVCTNNGVNMLHRGQEQFRNYTLAPFVSESQSVFTTYAGPDETVWFGNYSGLFRVDINRKMVRRYCHDSIDSRSINTNLVTRLLPDRFNPPHNGKGVLWIGTWDHGISKFDLDSQRFTPYHWAPLLNDNNVVYSLWQDDEGMLWIGTLREGLQRFNPRDGSFTGMGLQNLRVMALLETRDGHLWVATARAGLFCYDRVSGSVAHYLSQASNATSINDNSVSSLLEDPQRRLWVGTDKGLNLFDPGTQTFRRFDVSHGIPEDRIQSIVSDSTGGLWLAMATHGLVHFDPFSGKARSFSQNDGILDNRFYALVQLTHGAMIGGTEAGLVAFHPSQLRSVSCVPIAYLASFRIFDRIQNPHDFWSIHQSIELPYDSSFFSFGFVGLNFNNPDGTTYQYKLEGVDPAWVNAGTSRLAAYTKVASGHYTFTVRAGNGPGAFGKPEMLASITILPPYWETWWFRSLMALLAAGIVTTVYLYRVNKLLEMERMRLRIASDLHDEIGSSLGAIALMTDLLVNRDDLLQDAKEELSRIGLNARRSAEALRDIVWVINPESDKLDNMILRMKDTATQMLSSHAVRFQTNCTDIGPQSSIAFRRNLILIYKEALHNIVKHAEATEVSITMEERNGTLTMRIQDNGRGFGQVPQKRESGLRNMRRRAQEISGSVDIDGRSGRGTTIQLKARIT